MTRQTKIDKSTAKPAIDNTIEEHLLEQVVGGRGRGYSTRDRNQASEAAAEAVVEDPTPVEGHSPAPVAPEAQAAATVSPSLPTEEPTYDNPLDKQEEQKPEFDLSTSYTAEADDITSTYSAGIEGVLRGDSSGAAIGGELRASIMTEMNLGGGAVLTNTTESAISAGAQIMYDNGLGAEVAGEISVKVAWEVTRETDLGNGVTVDNSAKVEGFMGAKGQGDAYVGEEGGKYGFDLEAGASYTAETKGSIDASQVAATGEASISSAGSIGASFSQEASYKDGALTVGISGDVDAVLAGAGLGGSVSVQFEDKYGTVGSAADIAAVQAQLQHFDSEGDYIRTMTETWHNDLQRDAYQMRGLAEDLETKLEEHTQTLVSFDTAVGSAVDGLALREAALSEERAELQGREAELQARFGDAATFQQAVSDMRVAEASSVWREIESGLKGEPMPELRDISEASHIRPDEFERQAHQNFERPGVSGEMTDEIGHRMAGLDRSDPQLYEALKAYVVDAAGIEATEATLGFDKAVFQGYMQSEQIAEFKAVELTRIEGLQMQSEMADTLATSLEERYDTVKDTSYAAAVGTADRMVAMADANVADVAKDLATAQERLAAAQAEVDNSPTVGIRGHVSVSPEDAKALSDAQGVFEQAKVSMAQAMVDQEAAYAQAAAIHPEKSMAATEALAASMLENATAGAEAFAAQYQDVRMTELERAEMEARMGVFDLVHRFADITEDDGDKLAEKSAEFGETAEVLKAQLSLLTAIELKERGALSYAQEYFNVATATLGEGVTDMARAGDASIEAIGSAATDAGNAVVSAAEETARATERAANAVAGGVTSAANAVGNAAEDAWNSLW
jgi:hypothetical protein